MTFPMRRVIVIAVFIALAAGAIGYWIGARHRAAASGEEPRQGEEVAGNTEPSEEEKPVVPVVVAPLVSGPISETVEAYGTVVAEASDVRAVSVPFESRVVRILVTPGEQVARGAAIIEVQGSPDALVALQEAKNAVEAFTRDLRQTEQRFAEHLATNVELSQAQQAMQSARLKLDSLTQRGVGESHQLKSDFAGIVSKVDVQEGQIVAAGAPLVELAAGNRIEVRLNVEPGDAASLKPGAQVQLQPVSAPKPAHPIIGKVRMIGQRVDPATRLVEVRVSLPEDVHLLLDSFVSGQLARSAAEGFLVPRNAALPNEDGTYTLFTVKDNHAVQHVVRLGLEQDQQAQVIANDLSAGDPVVISGNYLLKDGMEVQVQAAPPVEPATQSATAPATAPAPATDSTDAKPEATP